MFRYQDSDAMLSRITNLVSCNRAQQLVCVWSGLWVALQVKLHMKGKPSHSEQQQQKEQQAKAAKEIAADSSSTANRSSKPAANGHAAAADSDTAAELVAKLSCSSCGVQLQGVKAAEAHAAATGHDSFEEVDDSA